MSSADSGCPLRIRTTVIGRPSEAFGRFGSSEPELSCQILAHHVNIFLRFLQQIKVQTQGFHLPQKSSKKIEGVRFAVAAKFASDASDAKNASDGHPIPLVRIRSGSDLWTVVVWAHTA